MSSSQDTMILENMPQPLEEYKLQNRKRSLLDTTTSADKKKITKHTHQMNQ